MSNGPNKPTKDDEVSGDGKVDRQGYVSRIGHRLDFSDKDGKGYIWLQTASGNEVTLSDAEEGIWIRSKDGHWVMLSDKHQGIKVHSKGGHELFMDDAGKKIVTTIRRKQNDDGRGRSSISFKANVKTISAPPRSTSRPMWS